jgi:1-pyrroline-5-carboxylate dehydrogenase
MRSAFSLQGQKCSACSRVYVDAKVADDFIRRLVEKTRAIKMGDPSDKDVYFGPVINTKAVKTFLDAAAQARSEGEILTGGDRLTDGAFAKGTFVAPTIAKLPLTSALFERELFVPFLSLGVVSGLDEALREANKVEFGLTAGIFSAHRAEIDRSTRWRPACATPTGAPARRPAPGPEFSPSADGRAPARPEKGVAAPTTWLSSCASRAAPSWSDRDGVRR